MTSHMSTLDAVPCSVGDGRWRWVHHEYHGDPATGIETIKTYSTIVFVSAMEALADGVNKYPSVGKVFRPVVTS